MALVTVAITGVDHDAKLMWNGSPKPLGSSGAGNFGTSFDEKPGKVVYSISVFGRQGDPWKATVTDGTRTNRHAGHMSVAGSDGTGDTPFTVS